MMMFGKGWSLLLAFQAKGFPLSVHMVYIFMKSGLFGRSKNLASSEVSSKLHVRPVPRERGCGLVMYECNVSVRLL